MAHRIPIMWAIANRSIAHRLYVAGIHVGLLVDAPDAFQRANIERILRTKVAWVSGVNLTAGLIILLLLLKRLNLCFGQDAAFLCHFGFQRFQPGFEVRQIMPKPDRPNARGRHEDTELTQFVRRSRLTIGWEVCGGLDNRLFNSLVNAAPCTCGPGVFMIALISRPANMREY